MTNSHAPGDQPMRPHAPAARQKPPTKRNRAQRGTHTRLEPKTLPHPPVKARNPLPKPRNAYKNNTQTNRTQTTREKKCNTRQTRNRTPRTTSGRGGVTKNPKFFRQFLIQILYQKKQISRPSGAPPRGGIIRGPLGPTKSVPSQRGINKNIQRNTKYQCFSYKYL